MKTYSLLPRFATRRMRGTGIEVWVRTSSMIRGSHIFMSIPHFTMISLLSRRMGLSNTEVGTPGSRGALLCCFMSSSSEEPSKSETES